MSAAERECITNLNNPKQLLKIIEIIFTLKFVKELSLYPGYPSYFVVESVYWVSQDEESKEKRKVNELNMHIV